jgi:hypothetical protein
LAFLLSLESDKRILWHVDRQAFEPMGKDRLGKRMKRQADRQVREEYKKARGKTG